MKSGQQPGHRDAVLCLDPYAAGSHVDQTLNYDDYGNVSLGAGAGTYKTALLYHGIFEDTVGTGLRVHGTGYTA